jgi:hypothetical protein
LILHCCHTVVTLLLHSFVALFCHTLVTLLLHVLLHCCYNVVTLLLHNCYTAIRSLGSWV